MHIPRIYHNGPITSGQTLQLAPAASHHLTTVLRLKPDAQVIVFNGQEGEYDSTIQKIHKLSVSLEIKQFHARQTQSPLNLHLAQAIGKPSKMDFVIQKATELGVTTITPVIGAHSSIKLTHQQLNKKQQHWLDIVINACEQCGRTILPSLQPSVPLTTWLTQVNATTKLILTPDSDNKLRKLPQQQHVALLIGPEGGFSEAELQLAALHQFQPISLGPRILRTETAAIATLAILQALSGDL